MDNSQLPAYPRTAFDRHGILTTDEEPAFSGLTKLEAFTMAAMQGILANPNAKNIIEVALNYNANPDKAIAMWAISAARATLSELSKKQP